MPGEWVTVFLVVVAVLAFLAGLSDPLFGTPPKDVSRVTKHPDPTGDEVEPEPESAAVRAKSVIRRYRRGLPATHRRPIFRTRRRKSIRARHAAAGFVVPELAAPPFGKPDSWGP